MCGLGCRPAVLAADMLRVCFMALQALGLTTLQILLLLHAVLKAPSKSGLKSIKAYMFHFKNKGAVS